MDAQLISAPPPWAVGATTLKEQTGPKKPTKKQVERAVKTLLDHSNYWGHLPTVILVVDGRVELHWNTGRTFNGAK